MSGSVIFAHHGWTEGGAMRDPTFQDAYARVRGRYADQVWLSLPPREITNLIYREMREIDLSRSSGADAGKQNTIAAAD
jgi:hypothetical protein